MTVYDLKTMQICKIQGRTAVALGTFDGCHLGHASVLRNAFYKAKELGIKSVAYTFDVPPAKEREMIHTLDEKIKAIAKFGIDYVVVESFGSVKDFDGEEFVENVLKGELGAVFAACGYNYRFGKGASAGSHDMKAMCEKAGIAFKEVKTLFINGETVSTTRIRGLIENGRSDEAWLLLGRPYSISGEVVHGNHIGTNMGIKTLNMLPDGKKALPKSGVYSTRCIIDGKLYKSVTDIGTKPTVETDNSMIIETHVFDFDDDAYGKTVRVEFLEYFRSEQAVIHFSNRQYRVRDCR